MSEEYTCDSCGYRTPRKSAFVKHQNRKIPCDKTVTSNPDVDEDNIETIEDAPIVEAPLKPLSAENDNTLQIEDVSEEDIVKVFSDEDEDDPSAHPLSTRANRIHYSEKPIVGIHDYTAHLRAGNKTQRKSTPNHKKFAKKVKKVTGYANKGAKQHAKYKNKTRKSFNITMVKRRSQTVKNN
ncbi:hypothetical protein TetV_365 [Tetraselmis virus 1]|uniref:C2H2-type domain-containing protein n=1 Tax=Tetraselmis virus 1 TaxID=2060617 RepID=A0A2P0VNH3_9VIRU|nr:hypothetical protein QJ968_gp365 [Tetraselmis virus 1]AUF82457.1 hypothetical protein TetV_365 [Tetraselmis virus 1]